MRNVEQPNDTGGFEGGLKFASGGGQIRQIYVFFSLFDTVLFSRKKGYNYCIFFCIFIFN